jgi:segregation and condensation protein A
MLQFKLEKFQGPLGLLLQIIEKEELDITEVSLAKIADQYLEYIKKSSEIDAEEMADFLVVAAKLLLIKSRALLPYLSPEEDEEIEELEQQLKMYKEFLEAAKKIEKMIGKKKFMFVREFNRQAFLSSHKTFSPPKNLEKDVLRQVFEDLLGRIKPMQEKLEEKKIEDNIKIEDKIRSIKDLVLKRIKFSFKNLLSDSGSKTEIIVSFLALLELVKQKDIVVNQNDLFGEIDILKN